ncbi:MAG TPA: nitroreductase family protein [Thermomicrobiaceae bacterium]|nr:nitroreductase family protein [Thermomicrobiaceae bacterium]
MTARIEIDELLRSLRAVRRYGPEPVPAGVLRAILEDARWTGSSKNEQPWQLLVVRERAMLQQLAQLGTYAGHLAGAPLALVLLMERQPGRAFDAGRLAQTIMTAAWGHGLGSCIASLYPEANERRARELLGVPDDLSADTAIALGYPESPAARTLAGGLANVRAIVPAGRMPLRELVSWERYGIHRPG